MKQNKSTKGFTLIELLIVVGVIAVLAGIVLVSLRGAKEGAELARAKRDAATNNRLLVCEQGKMMDLEGNLYDTVEIDGLCWMKENLRYLPEVHDNSTFASLGGEKKPAYGIYDYDGSDLETAKSQTRGGQVFMRHLESSITGGQLWRLVLLGHIFQLTKNGTH